MSENSPNDKTKGSRNLNEKPEEHPGEALVRGKDRMSMSKRPGETSEERHVDEPSRMTKEHPENELKDVSKDVETKEKDIKAKEKELEELKQELQNLKKREQEYKRRRAEEKKIKDLIDGVRKEIQIDESIIDFLEVENKKMMRDIDKELLDKFHEKIQEKNKRIKEKKKELERLVDEHEKTAVELRATREDKNDLDRYVRELRMLPSNVKALKRQLHEHRKCIESLKGKENVLKKIVYLSEMRRIIKEIENCKERKNEIIADKKWKNSKEIIRAYDEKGADFSNSLVEIKNAKASLGDMKKTKTMDIVKEMEKVVQQSKISRGRSSRL